MILALDKKVLEFLQRINTKKISVSMLGWKKIRFKTIRNVTKVEWINQSKTLNCEHGFES